MVYQPYLWTSKSCLRNIELLLMPVHNESQMLSQQPKKAVKYSKNSQVWKFFQISSAPNKNVTGFVGERVRDYEFGQILRLQTLRIAFGLTWFALIRSWVDNGEFFVRRGWWWSENLFAKELPKTFGPLSPFGCCRLPSAGGPDGMALLFRSVRKSVYQITLKGEMVGDENVEWEPISFAGFQTICRLTFKCMNKQKLGSKDWQTCRFKSVF